MSKFIFSVLILNRRSQECNQGMVNYFDSRASKTTRLEQCIFTFIYTIFYGIEAAIVQSV
jgi:hypothetical protein